MNALNNLVQRINRLRFDPEAGNLEDFTTTTLVGFLSLVAVIAML